MANEEKLFYTIGEVAEILQLKPYVLRYWESEFKKLNPQKSFTGQRTYRVRDIQLALTIKKLLYDDKYTIAGAIQKLDELEAAKTLVNFPGGTSSVGEMTAPGTEAPVVPVEMVVEKPVATVDPEKVKNLKTLVEATKKLLKKYNLS